MTTDGGDRSLGTPRFDVVLRGYDRRQVDEHVARLQRVLARMRADLDVARSQPLPVVPPPSGGFPATGQPTPAGGSRPRPTPRPRPGVALPAGESPDMIGSFTDRMQSILQAAEEEAEEIRTQARSAAKADHEAARAELAELTRQRDAVLADLTRLRGQLEGLLSGPTARIAVPPRDAGQGGPVPGGAAPAQPGAAQGGPAQGAAAQVAPGQQAPAQSGPGWSGTGSGQGRPAPSGATPKAPASGGPAQPSSGRGRETAPAPSSAPVSAGQPLPGTTPPAPAAGRSATAPSPGNRPAPSAAASGSADVEATTSMRPRNEPAPQPGDLFRPVSEGRRDAVEDEPVTTAVPRQSPAPTSGSTPASSGAESGRSGQSGDGTAASADVEKTVLVQAVRPTGGTTGSDESANADEQDKTPSNTDKKRAADARPSGSSNGPSAGQTVKVGFVRPGAPGSKNPSEPKNSSSAGVAEKSDDASKGTGTTKDDGADADGKSESGNSVSRSDRSASGSRSG